MHIVLTIPQDRARGTERQTLTYEIFCITFSVANESSFKIPIFQNLHSEKITYGFPRNLVQ